jgi:hypothetical protein
MTRIEIGTALLWFLLSMDLRFGFQPEIVYSADANESVPEFTMEAV